MKTGPFPGRRRERPPANQPEAHPEENPAAIARTGQPTKPEAKRGDILTGSFEIYKAVVRFVYLPAASAAGALMFMTLAAQPERVQAGPPNEGKP